MKSLGIREFACTHNNMNNDKMYNVVNIYNNVSDPVRYNIIIVVRFYDRVTLYLVRRYKDTVRSDCLSYDITASQTPTPDT